MYCLTKKIFLHILFSILNSKRTNPCALVLYCLFSGYFDIRHPSQICLRYVCTLRLIGPILYPGECDLMIHPQKYSVIFSRMHFVTVVRV